MKIAVTYDNTNGQVFQHFGHTECFKVYEVDEDKIVSSEIVDSEGQGHGALAGFLAEEAVDVLICGGIGAGAQSALEDMGIDLIAGAIGDADEVLEGYLKGELISTGANCNHHGEEHECGGHGCGHHEDGSGCGHGCGGCHPTITGKNVGKTCRVHYRGTFNDGTQFDASYDRGEPIEFICGAGMMILGFDKAVAQMELGEKKTIHLLPEEAYGEADPNAIITLPIAQLPGSEELEVGQQVYLTNSYTGQPIPVKVVEKDSENITFDANHEMAGKELNFEIELVEVIDAD